MKLLLAVDDTVFSERAIEALCHISWLGGSELLILNVVKPIEYLSPLGTTDDTEQRELQLIHARSEWLDGIQVRFEEKLPHLKISHKVKFGDTKFVIVSTAAEEGTDLIVVGTRGRTGVERWLLGSVSAGVVEYAPCPTMVIKGEKETWNDFERILVAFDGSAYSHDAIDWICDRDWPSGTKVHIVMTMPEFTPIDADAAKNAGTILEAQWRMIHGHAVKILQLAQSEIAAKIGAANVTIEALPGDPRQELIKAASAFDAKMIVVGSRGRTGLTKFLLGSVSLHLANHASIPIIVVRRLAPETLKNIATGREVENRF